MTASVKIYKKGVLVTDTTDLPTGLASFAMQMEKIMQEDNASLELQVFEANGKEATSLHFARRAQKMTVKGHILYAEGDAQVPDDICDDNGQVVTERCKGCDAQGDALAAACTRAMG